MGLPRDFTWHFLDEICHSSTSYVVATQSLGSIEIDPYCVKTFLETDR